MPKPQYTQKFRDCWLRDPGLKDWLQVVESTGGPVAKCKLCGTLLRNHYGVLKNHRLSKKHLQNSKVCKFITNSTLSKVLSRQARPVRADIN